jgi:hypothetical protein
LEIGEILILCREDPPSNDQSDQGGNLEFNIEKAQQENKKAKFITNHGFYVSSIPRRKYTPNSDSSTPQEITNSKVHSALLNSDSGQTQP